MCKATPHVDGRLHVKGGKLLDGSSYVKVPARGGVVCVERGGLQAGDA